MRGSFGGVHLPSSPTPIATSWGAQKPPTGLMADHYGVPAPDSGSTQVHHLGLYLDPGSQSRTYVPPCCAYAVRGQLCRPDLPDALVNPSDVHSLLNPEVRLREAQSPNSDDRILALRQPVTVEFPTAVGKQDLGPREPMTAAEKH